MTMGIAEAAVPKLITVQGRLRNATTLEPLEGTFNITFGIYNVASGGTSLYTEAHDVTTDEFGIFQVIMGSITTLDLPFDVQYYLEIIINGTTLSPRHTMTAAAYTYRANVSTDLECTTCVSSDEIADDAVNIDKLDCVNISWAMGAGNPNVAINISGICDDNDGCMIRLLKRPTGIFPTMSFGGYMQNSPADGKYRFLGVENNTGTAVAHAGTNGDSLIDVIVIADTQCELDDDGGSPCTATEKDDFCGYSGAGSGTCYLWVCD